MNSKIWKWAEVVANSAPYAFWTIWGMGLGAFGAVFFKAVDVGGDALKVYLAILTVMMGAALGLITSRGMDILADRRKRRRKIYAVISRIGGLVIELEGLQTLIDSDVGARAKSGEQNLSDGEIAHILVRAGRIRKAAAHLPNFEEIVESERDSKIEALCRSNFVNVDSLFDVGDDKLSGAQRRSYARTFMLVQPDKHPGSAAVVLRFVADDLRKKVDK